MSFMFNPYPYEDPTPINRPSLSSDTIDSIVAGDKEIAVALAEVLETKAESNPSLIVNIDGYVSAQWASLVNLISQQLRLRGIVARAIDASTCYKAQAELDEMLKDNLEEDLEKDPVLLFGKLFPSDMESLFEPTKLQGLQADLENAKATSTKTVTMVYGIGACYEPIKALGDLSVYLDVTPKQAILRIKNGGYKNLGDTEARPYKALMRRCYYYDFELACHLRAHLIKEDKVDYYIASDVPGECQLIGREAFAEICSSLVQYPFRCKPVYLEGIWGGYYIQNLRNLPKEMKNCAWVFDLIPLEVSLLVEAGSKTVEIPFFTFVCKEGTNLMGQECVDAFGGYFPIRFNYDDSFHSSGNMSIQLHPPGDYCKEHFGEHGRQDESYYVVATGHGAKTYMGLEEGSDPDEFIAAVKESEVSHTPVDYDSYVHAVESKPGTQFMIPAGTIHSSGRNQVVLEIGSLTVGSYTFKMYDYLRDDLDGKPRPIHSYHGERVLAKERTTSWVHDNIVQNPQLVREGDGWAEYIVGEHDLLYFTLRRYEFEKTIESNTDGKFHVLTLVDGEKVAVYSKDNPELRYEPNYLDVVVVPANVGEYVIENLGDQPVCVHKTMLKENFQDCI